MSVDPALQNASADHVPFLETLRPVNVGLHRHLARNVLIATAAACSAAILLYFGISQLVIGQTKADAWVAHTLTVLERTAVLEGNLANAVSEGRGFLLDPVAERRSRVETNLGNVRDALGTLAELTTDNPVQREAITQLVPLIDARVAALRDIMDRASTSNLPEIAQIFRAATAMPIALRIHSVIMGMRAEERRLLTQRGIIAQGASRNLLLALVGCGLLASICMGAVVAVLLRRRQDQTTSRAESLHLAELRREQDRFRAAVKAVHGVLWTNDAQGWMVGEQPGWAGLTGQAYAQYQGFGWATAVHPDDAEPTIEAWNAAVADRRVFVFEHRVRCIEGNYRTFAVRAAPVLDSNGNVREWVGVHTDVTAERSAELTNIHLAAIVTGSQDALISFAPDNGQILTWNAGAERLFGYSQADAIGGPVSLLLPPASGENEEATNVFLAAKSGASIVEHETLRRAKSGELIPVSVTATRMLGANGRLLGVSGTFHDLRPRRRNEMALREANADLERRVQERTTAMLAVNQELEKSNGSLDRLARHLARARDQANAASRAKSRFLASMSHELRTPLNGILGYAHLIRADGGLSPLQASRIETMLGAGQHLLEMISGILSLSEIEQQQVTLQLTTVNLGKLVSECIDVVQPLAVSKKLALSVDIAVDTPATAVVDPTRLRQILLNLLGNAVKFTFAGAVSLRVRTSHMPPEPGADNSVETPLVASIRFDVTDTGPGIPPEKRERLFRDFERLAADPNAIEGAGLGLALSTRLASLMGGSMGYADNPEGGSVFWVELPLRKPEAQAEPSPSPAVSAPYRRVLVVDDVAMNRDIAAAFLQPAGYDITCLDNGTDAVAAAAKERFDVILMDVRMPGIDGLEATRRIRALPAPHGQVPVIALTAQAFAEQIAECRQAGMNAHLAKPFSPDALCAAVAGAVEVSHEPLADATSTVAEQCNEERVLVVDATFDFTSSCLPPEEVRAYLQGIAERATALAARLARYDATPSRHDPELASLAHALAGSAGLFGFDRLSAAAQAFEYALTSATGEPDHCVATLFSALEATVPELSRRIAAPSATAAVSVP